MKSIIYTCLLIWPSLGLAQESLSTHIGTAVRAVGNIRHLHTGSSNPDGPSPRVKYDGLHYTQESLQVGGKVRPGDVILTGNNGQTKLVFSNGDHVAIGPSTSYMYTQQISDDRESTSLIKLLYGKFRAVISQTGPRKKTEIRTQTAVAGVRGTDFFISSTPTSGTEISVLRGKVKVLPVLGNGRPSKLVPPITINTGEMAFAGGAYDERQNGEPTLLSKEITKEVLLAALAVSTIERTDISEVGIASGKKSELQSQVESLEKAALNMVKEDIQLEQPGAAASLEEAGKDISSDSLNLQVIAELYKTAPSAKPGSKPTRKEIESMGEDVYKEHFE